MAAAGGTPLDLDHAGQGGEAPPPLLERLAKESGELVRLAMVDGRELMLSSRKSLAILTYLTLQSTRSESRERIAALLWSDSGGEHGRAALRQTLRRLKLDLGPAEDLVEADRNSLRLTVMPALAYSRAAAWVRPRAFLSARRCSRSWLVRWMGKSMLVSIGKSQYICQSKF